MRTFFSKKVVKIRPLLPVLKEKKRYLLYEIDSKEKMSNANNTIEKELRGFVGDLGLAKAGLKFIKQKDNKGIIKVNNKSVDEIKTGLMLIKEINNNPARVSTLKVSGVINKLKAAM